MSTVKNNNIFEKTSFLGGNSSEFIEELYAQYVQNPESISNEWKEFFDGLRDKKEEIINTAKGPSWSRKRFKKIIQKNGEEVDTNGKAIKDINVDVSTFIQNSKDSIRANTLMRAYRIRGHLLANLDPLGLQVRQEHPELKPETYGFANQNINRKIYLDGTLGLESADLKTIINEAKKVYCGNIGYEYMHMSDPVERSWIRERIEGKEKGIRFTENGKKAILNKLIEAEGFEKFLHVKFVGTKRFGLDGAESLIPALEQIIKRGGHLGVKEVKIGMPHRGRLNVLANMMQKPFKLIFKEFFGEKIDSKKDFEGDVKYHLGASANREFDGNLVHISLTDNPSHLEAVNPVVLGQVRAKQFFHKDKERKKVIPVLIHGDAAFAGQGVVAECFAMSG